MNSSSSREIQKWAWLWHSTNSGKAIVLMRYQIKRFQAASGDQAIRGGTEGKNNLLLGSRTLQGKAVLLTVSSWWPADTKHRCVWWGLCLFKDFGIHVGFYQESKGLLEAVSSFSCSILLLCPHNANSGTVPCMPFPEAVICSIIVGRPLLFRVRPLLVLLPHKERLVVMPTSLKVALPSPQAPASWSNLSACFAYS